MLDCCGELRTLVPIYKSVLFYKFINGHCVSFLGCVILPPGKGVFFVLLCHLAAFLLSLRSCLPGPRATLVQDHTTATGWRESSHYAGEAPYNQNAVEIYYVECPACEREIEIDRKPREDNLATLCTGTGHSDAHAE